MATLTVASRADAFLTLPVILALSNLSQVEPSFQFTLNFADKKLLGSNGHYAEFAMADGTTLDNDAAIDFAFKKLPSHLGGNQKHVGGGRPISF